MPNIFENHPTLMGIVGEGVVDGQAPPRRALFVGDSDVWLGGGGQEMNTQALHTLHTTSHTQSTHT